MLEVHPNAIHKGHVQAFVESQHTRIDTVVWEAFVYSCWEMTATAHESVVYVTDYLQSTVSLLDLLLSTLLLLQCQQKVLSSLTPKGPDLLRREELNQAGMICTRAKSVLTGLKKGLRSVQTGNQIATSQAFLDAAHC